MSLGILNITCLGIGVVALGCSLVKATHERKYWRKKEGYALHVTLDVVLYFLTGALIVVYNIYHIVGDYMDSLEMQNQSARLQEAELKAKIDGTTLELKPSTPTPMYDDGNLTNNDHNVASFPESSC